MAGHIEFPATSTCPGFQQEGARLRMFIYHISVSHYKLPTFNHCANDMKRIICENALQAKIARLIVEAWSTCAERKMISTGLCENPASTSCQNEYSDFSSETRLC